MTGLIYLIIAFLFVGGSAFLAFLCLKKYNGNMGTNIGKHNNARWGMDEGQEKDWY